MGEAGLERAKPWLKNRKRREICEVVKTENTCGDLNENICTKLRHMKKVRTILESYNIFGKDMFWNV